ncbi:MAG TPA: Ig-like domain-containing protein [Gemmatimonadaceae bacterium]|nr:Ig-like domain-containing protein [Gemmatimonadaceae bacterium]
MAQPGSPSAQRIVAALVALCAACGGGSAAPSAPGDNPPGGAGAHALAQLSLAVVPQTIEAGRTATGYVTGADAAGNLTATGPVTWGSSAPAVATVNADGAVAALAPGTATITATAGGLSAMASFTVTALVPPAVVLHIEPGEARIAVGETLPLRAFRVVSRDSTEVTNLLWQSSAPDVATVSAAGTVTGVTGGTSVIRGTGAGLAGTMSVAVVAHADTSIHINLGSPQPGEQVGDTLHVVSTITPLERRLASAIVSIDGVDFPLDTVWLGAMGSVPGWGRDISLSNIPIGLHQMVLTAHAADGAVAADTLTIDREIEQSGGVLPVGGRKRVVGTGGTFVPPTPPRKPVPKRPGGP